MHNFGPRPRISASNEHIQSCRHLIRKVRNFFVELGPQGELPTHLAKLRLGDTTLCSKVAKGRFTLDIFEEVQFHTGEGCVGRVVDLVDLLWRSPRMTGVQYGPAKIRIRIKCSFSISEEAS
jgi:hypothetical protein